MFVYILWAVWKCSLFRLSFLTLSENANFRPNEALFSRAPNCLGHSFHSRKHPVYDK